MLGQTILSTGGFLLAGQPLKTAMQCSFSLTQIGEFAFILATLGTSLHVTSDFLYPIVVAVSVFTTFTTPYMIRLAEPAYAAVSRILPKRFQEKLEDYSLSEEESEESLSSPLASGKEAGAESHWGTYLKQTALYVLIHSVICMALIALMLYFGKPYIANLLSQPWADIVTALLTLILCASFLWMLMLQGSHSEDAVALWNESRLARVKLVAFQLLRLVIGAAFVSYIISKTVRWGGMLGLFVILAIVFSIVFSPSLRKRSQQITKTFNENLTQRENNEE
jgi:CPA2 family monovalent cation:H+ antiporter-2